MTRDEMERRRQTAIAQALHLAAEDPETRVDWGVISDSERRYWRRLADAALDALGLEQVGWDNPSSWPVPWVRLAHVPSPKEPTRVYRLQGES